MHMDVSTIKGRAYGALVTSTERKAESKPAELIWGNRSRAGKCEATGCTWATEPRSILCLTHWRRLSSSLQVDLWAAYRSFPEKSPSKADLMSSEQFLNSADAAVSYLAQREGLAPDRHFADALEKLRMAV
jgi:hypothetical protein